MGRYEPDRDSPGRSHVPGLIAFVAVSSGRNDAALAEQFSEVRAQCTFGRPPQRPRNVGVNLIQKSCQRVRVLKHPQNPGFTAQPVRPNCLNAGRRVRYGVAVTGAEYSRAEVLELVQRRQIILHVSFGLPDPGRSYSGKQVADQRGAGVRQKKG